MRMPSLTPGVDSNAAKVTQESTARISQQVIGVGKRCGRLDTSPNELKAQRCTRLPHKNKARLVLDEKLASVGAFYEL